MDKEKLNGQQKNSSKTKEIIQRYVDIKNPGSFLGIDGFIKNNNNKLERNEVEAALKHVPAYSLHKPVNSKFKRNKTIVGEIDEQWQIDLCDVSNLKNKKLSQFYNFLFVAIDSFSRFAFVVPIKDKSSEETTIAIKYKFKSSNRKPKYLYSDHGKEFLGAFKKFVESENIRHFFTKSVHKASIVERLNRTLKQKMYRYFKYSNTKNYKIILNDLVDSYNNTYHSSIKMTPSEVNKSNEKKVYANQYDSYFKVSSYKFKFQIGDYVRIPVDKKLFEKGYT